MTTIVVVVKGILKDCLLGMDLLESCPLTKNIIKQLRFLLESKVSSTRPKQVKRLNKLIFAFDKQFIESSEWIQVPESSTKEFFDGIEAMDDIQSSSASSKVESTGHDPPTNQNDDIQFLASQLIILLGKQVAKEISSTILKIPPIDTSNVTTHRVSSIQDMSPEWKNKLKEEDKISALTMEVQQISNWFQVNEINMDDLDDEQTFSSQIREDMNIIELRESMLKYVECISSTGLASLSSTAAVGVSHVIELMEEKPFRDKYRQVPHSKRDEFNKYLNELVDNGFIVESKSNYSSCPNVLLKPDGSVRFTIDYKKINSLTKKDNYPLPIIDNLFKDMVGCTFFSKKDLDSGYYQCLMDPASQKYTAFSCEFGLFEWTRMPMGLRNSGCTFQRMMDKILQPLIGKVCHVYQDDVIVFSKSVEQHKLDLEAVVQLLKEAQLKIKLKKCSFFQKEIEFLGHTISNGQIKPSKSKIEALFRYERPQTVKQLFSFLGLATYYKKFIDNFTVLAHALYECANENRLNKRGIKNWNTECQQSFDGLRTYLTDTDKVLMLPDLNKAFKLFCDGCLYGVGSTLTQQDDQLNWRPVSYFSKHLSKTERRYSVSEIELLSIIRAVEFNKQFLLCSKIPCIVVTDHQPLIYLLNNKNPSSRLLRWITRLEQYTLRFEYRKGSQHGNADALSRWPLPDADEDGHDDYNDIVINEVIFETIDSLMKIKHSLINNKNDSQYIEFKVQLIGFKQINGAHLQQSDCNIQLVMKHLRNSQSIPENLLVSNPEQRVYAKEFNNLIIHKEALWRKAIDKLGNEFSQFVVPAVQRVQTMEQMHSNLLNGHLMMDKTFRRITSRFFWPFMKRDVQQFISECEKCQLATHPHKTTKALLKSIRVDRVLEMVTSDFLGPLKKSRNGNYSILVLVDQKSKFCWLRATRNQLATTTAKIIAKVELEFGIFEQLLTDQGTNFESHLIAELCELLDTNKLHTSVYHPECDGLSERLNQTVIKMIKTFINDQHTNWDELLPSIEFAYNTATQATTGMTPYLMMFGRNPKCPEDLMFNKPEIDFPVTDDSYVSETKENLKTAFDLVQQHSNSKIKISEIYYNRNTIACKFKLGDLVWARQFKPEQGQCKKFSPKWKGPYTVIECMDGLVYSLKPIKPKGKRITMHRNNLKRYVQRKQLGNKATEVDSIPSVQPIAPIAIISPTTTNPKEHPIPNAVEVVVQVPVQNRITPIVPVQQTKRGRGRPPKSITVINNNLKQRTTNQNSNKPVLPRKNPPRTVNKNKNYK